MAGHETDYQHHFSGWHARHECERSDSQLATRYGAVLAIKLRLHLERLSAMAEIDLAVASFSGFGFPPPDIHSGEAIPDSPSRSRTPTAVPILLVLIACLSYSVVDSSSLLTKRLFESVALGFSFFTLSSRATCSVRSG